MKTFAPLPVTSCIIDGSSPATTTGPAIWSLHRALNTIMAELGLEGVVAKRSASPYRSGQRKEWVKIECLTWLAKNREWWKAFA